jgi:hypothetical protein
MAKTVRKELTTLSGLFFFIFIVLDSCSSLKEATLRKKQESGI